MTGDLLNRALRAYSTREAAYYVYLWMQKEKEFSLRGSTQEATFIL
jgi:hypothetical protein